ncbi:short-chain dehydrogenase [Diplogelasinospora grovesii]|uniref:Short-chain dehydrogenase n=1 Tax=Diplogelasinospora grovesii TaxID=303347 RepID=A0AAN6NGQ4_9PEZI|nr:short-chain dehydrogenase [Diplogelasinospora grovesii]
MPCEHDGIYLAVASTSAIYLLCLQAQGDEAIKTIIDANPGVTEPGNLKFIQLDLLDLESVKAAAATFAKQEAKLDVLWNNAGMGACRVAADERTVQGFEPMVGMHCIATLLFTTLLLPQLQAAGAARVLWLASQLIDEDAPLNGVDFDKLDSGFVPYVKDTNSALIKNYTMSKAGTWFTGREFARRHEKDGIMSVILNPGNLKTNTWEGSPALVTRFFHTFVTYDAIYGAYTELYAGLSPELTMEKHNGVYVIPWGRIHPDEKFVSHEACGRGRAYAKKLDEWYERQWKLYV